MMTPITRLALVVLLFVVGILPGRASDPVTFKASELAAAFTGAEQVDLATSRMSSVVKLREVVGIEPPDQPVLVKTFRRESLPAVLQPVFARKGVAGVTISGRYVAILHTDLPKEHEDILNHELVHAYITMASPQPLPFWFQEASAVHFSTDKGRKFYGEPSKDNPRIITGKVVDLDESYKQKLQSFHYLIERSGPDKFYKWYKDTVLTGNVDARPLLGLKDKVEEEPIRRNGSFPMWLVGVIGAGIIAVAIAGYISMRRGEDDI